MGIIRSIARDIKYYLRLKKHQQTWLKVRGNNFTRAANIFPIDCVSVGDYSYGDLYIEYYNQPQEKITIGKYCCIAKNVKFFTGGGHNYRHITSYPFKNMVTENSIQEATTKGPIIIEDDVWIGDSCIILSGVKIGKGAVIGAGSVVAKDIPPYAIFCGTEVKKFRFSKEIIDKLLCFDLGHINFYEAKPLFNVLYTEVTEKNIDDILNEIVCEDKNEDIGRDRFI